MLWCCIDLSLIIGYCGLLNNASVDVKFKTKILFNVWITIAKNSTTNKSYRYVLKSQPPLKTKQNKNSKTGKFSQTRKLQLEKWDRVLWMVSAFLFTTYSHQVTLKFWEWKQYGTTCRKTDVLERYMRWQKLIFTDVILWRAGMIHAPTKIDFYRRHIVIFFIDLISYRLCSLKCICFTINVKW